MVLRVGYSVKNIAYQFSLEFSRLVVIFVEHVLSTSNLCLDLIDEEDGDALAEEQENLDRR